MTSMTSMRCLQGVNGMLLSQPFDGTCAELLPHAVFFAKMRHAHLACGASCCIRGHCGSLFCPCVLLSVPCAAFFLHSCHCPPLRPLELDIALCQIHGMRPNQMLSKNSCGHTFTLITMGATTVPCRWEVFRPRHDMYRLLSMPSSLNSSPGFFQNTIRSLH